VRYACLLTPAGASEKSKLTAKFLKLKAGEYETLQAESQALKSELKFDGCSAKGFQGR
jgi:hypothetical protein